MTRRLDIAIAALVVSLSSCAPDVYHDDQVAALGAEVAGVAPGPLHRPGEPCLVCHGGSGPGKPTFAVGGTIFAVQGQTDPAPGATVSITDSSGDTRTVTTNAAGNFYLLASQWSPVYPLSGITVTLDTLTASMTTRVGRSGSCATCHTDPASNDSVGHVYLAVDPSDLPAGVSP